MKNLLHIICLLSFTLVMAQDDSEGEGGSGIVGYIQLGTNFRLPNDFGAEMNAVLGENETYSQIGLMLGAGGFYKTNGKLIFGVNGFGVLYPQVSGRLSTVSPLSIAINANAGYILKDNGKWLLYPHLGIGGVSHTVSIDNFGNLVNQGSLFIPPGRTEDINSQLMFLDIGGNLWRAITPVGGKYFGIGLSAGFKQAIFGTVWETSEGFNLDNLSDPAFSTFYVTLNLGGGAIK